MAIKIDEITLHDLRKIGFSLNLSAPDRAVVTYFAQDGGSFDFYENQHKKTAAYHLKLEWYEEVTSPAIDYEWQFSMRPSTMIVRKRAGWELSENDVLPILNSTLVIGT